MVRTIVAPTHTPFTTSLVQLSCIIFGSFTFAIKALVTVLPPLVAVAIIVLAGV